MNSRVLVLDANILMRAVLGKGVRSLLDQYGERVHFVAPDVAFLDARRHLPGVINRRRLEEQPFIDYFKSLTNIVQTIGREAYADFEEIARLRIGCRDEDDWPIVAVALALNSAIWTEDRDFFGCGVATWTSDRVELHLIEIASSGL